MMLLPFEREMFAVS